MKSNFVPSNCHSTNWYPCLVGFFGTTAVLFSIILCFATAEPPSLSNVTSYLLTFGSSFHLATRVILFVTFCEKSYLVLPKYQPSKMKASLVGSGGSLADSPGTIDCLATAVPPSLLNVTV